MRSSSKSSPVKAAQKAPQALLSSPLRGAGRAALVSRRTSDPGNATRLQRSSSAGRIQKPEPGAGSSPVKGLQLSSSSTGFAARSPAQQLSSSASSGLFQSGNYVSADFFHSLSTQGVFDLLGGKEREGWADRLGGHESTEAPSGSEPGTARTSTSRGSARGSRRLSGSFAAGDSKTVKRKGLEDCDESDNEEVQAPKASQMLAFINAAPERGTAVLHFAKIRDIVALNFASRACHEFCSHPDSRKLLVPILHYNWCAMPHIHLPSVEALVADNIAVAKAKENDTTCAQIVECSALRDMSFSHNNRFGIVRMIEMFGQREKLQLRVLDLAHNGLGEEATKVHKLFAVLPSGVEDLHLNHNDLQDEQCYQLFTSFQQRRVRVQRLQLRSNYFGDGCGYALSAYLNDSAGSCLHTLDLRANKIGPDGGRVLLKAVQAQAVLDDLRLGFNLEMDNSFCVQAAQLLQDRKVKLRYFDLASAKIGDAGCMRIASGLAKNARLKRLDLSFNRIGPGGVAPLAGCLEQNFILEVLDLRDNICGDEGAKALASSLRLNRTLKQLLLARNEVKDLGANEFVTMLKHNNSVMLDLTGNDIQFGIKLELRKRMLRFS